MVKFHSKARYEAPTATFVAVAVDARLLGGGFYSYCGRHAYYV